MAELISIIVTTHDREDALDAVLRSLARQTDGDFEVIVADDGSGPATAALIGQWKAKFGRRLEHVWHEHRGFRAGEIRNRALLESRAIIVSSSTAIASRVPIRCEPPCACRRGWFVSGNRILIVAGFQRRVLEQHHRAGKLEFCSMVAAAAAMNQPPRADAGVAARAVAQIASRRMAACAFMQSRSGLRNVSRPRRRFRCRL
jgi:glycosyltransferase involved in cell wall biosynthesis